MRSLAAWGYRGTPRGIRHYLNSVLCWGRRFIVYLLWCKEILIGQTRQASWQVFNRSDVVRSLHKLRDLHHLRLYDEGVPSPTPIAMMHPFSHLYLCQNLTLDET